MSDLKERLRVTREVQGKEIDRWFSQTPLGIVFYAPNGKAYPIHQAEMEEWRERALRHTDSVVEGENKLVMIGFAIGFAAFFICATLLTALGLARDTAVVAGGSIGAMCGMAYIRKGWTDFKKGREDIRIALAHHLRGRSPVPLSVAESSRRTNPYNTVFLWLIWGLLSISVSAASGSPLLNALPDGLLAGMFIGGLILTITLHAIARFKDRRQS